MKLSEAIREGAKLLPPQSRHAFFERDGGQCVASSAWGAVYHAEFGLDTAWMDIPAMWRKLVKAFPETQCVIRAQNKPSKSPKSALVDFVSITFKCRLGGRANKSRIIWRHRGSSHHRQAPIRDEMGRAERLVLLVNQAIDPTSPLPNFDYKVIVDNMIEQIDGKPVYD